MDITDSKDKLAAELIEKIWLMFDETVLKAAPKEEDGDW